jgi:hypothetical protein
MKRFLSILFVTALLGASAAFAYDNSDSVDSPESSESDGPSGEWVDCVNPGTTTLPDVCVCQNPHGCYSESAGPVDYSNVNWSDDLVDDNETGASDENESSASSGGNSGSSDTGSETNES